MTARARKKSTAAYKRMAPRKSVLLKARLEIKNYRFDCLVYDLSLLGARVRFDLPLQTDESLCLVIRDSQPIDSRIVWVDDGFMGLAFLVEPDLARKLLGPVAAILDEDKVKAVAAELTAPPPQS